MSEVFQIQTHMLRSGFTSMIQQLSDCRLRCGEDYFDCSRILLASESKWFRDYFKDHPAPPRTKQEIALDDCPEQVFKHFFELAIFGKTEITTTQLVALLKSAIKYEFNSLIRFLSLTIMTSTNESNVIQMVEQFGYFSLDEQSTLITDVLAPIFAQFISNDNSVRYAYDLDDIILYTNPILFFSLLEHPLIATIVILITQYSKHHKLDDTQKIKLSHFVKWNQPEFLKYFSNFECDWLPINFQRQVISNILDNRRTTVKSFIKSSETAQNDTVNRWYLMPWMRSIQEAEREVNNPEIDLFAFAKTLGNQCNYINTHQYGFLSTFITVKPIHPRYDAPYIFENNRFFLSKTTPDRPALIGISCGKGSHFIPHSIFVNTTVSSSNENNNMTNTTYQYSHSNFNLEFDMALDSKDIPQNKVVHSTMLDKYEKHISPSGLVYPAFTNDSLNPNHLQCSDFALKFVQKGKAQLLRVSDVEIRGSFNP